MSNIKKSIKKIIPKNFFKKAEPTWHLMEAIAANIRYGFPSRKMHVIGVTGTNGKTTTTNMIHRMLHEAGYKTAILSTVARGVGNNIIPEHAHVTTAPSFILQKYIKEFKDVGVEWLVLETSSHSLSQNRVWGVPYEIGVMTNVTGDHLDYHGTFKNYLNAKRKLFKLVSKNSNGYGVANAEDTNYLRFTDLVSSKITYGIKKGKIRANDIKMFVDHSTYTAKIGKDIYNITVNLPGDFNISNSLAAVAVGRRIGLSKEQIENGISALTSVEGRMALVNEGQKYRVIVDHASTPDAFEKFFSNVRPNTKGKLIAVFGSAGRRDEAKRAVQGKIAGKYCDEVIVTEEDDRDIDGDVIIKQIADGSKSVGKKLNKDLFLVHDRAAAIEFSLTRAKSRNDTIVLLGKGHEKTIERNDGEFYWNETELVTKLINKQLNKTNQ